MIGPLGSYPLEGALDLGLVSQLGLGVAASGAPELETQQADSCSITYRFRQVRSLAVRVFLASSSIVKRPIIRAISVSGTPLILPETVTTLIQDCYLTVT